MAMHPQTLAAHGIAAPHMRPGIEPKKPSSMSSMSSAGREEAKAEREKKEEEAEKHYHDLLKMVELEKSRSQKPSQKEAGEKSKKSNKNKKKQKPKGAKAHIDEKLGELTIGEKGKEVGEPAAEQTTPKHKLGETSPRKYEVKEDEAGSSKTHLKEATASEHASQPTSPRHDTGEGQVTKSGSFQNIAKEATEEGKVPSPKHHILVNDPGLSHILNAMPGHDASTSKYVEGLSHEDQRAIQQAQQSADSPSHRGDEGGWMQVGSRKGQQEQPIPVTAVPKRPGKGAWADRKDRGYRQRSGASEDMTPPQKLRRRRLAY